MKTIPIRASDSTIEKINYIRESLHCSKADVLEACVTIVYSAIVVEQTKTREEKVQ
ncbi:hypothetical protein [Cellulosilyticum sp. WCF-2]|uniref:hypothetical protein n=1 Tax=Cellulosilyticum sp. WCF-2 TaxID=2497860 RepID=UPI0016801CCA|nr:hypothetical protein [Cellulosilyticum sp. WCF-2]